MTMVMHHTRHPPLDRRTIHRRTIHRRITRLLTASLLALVGLSGVVGSATAAEPITIAVMPTDAPEHPVVGVLLRKAMQTAVSEVPELTLAGQVGMTLDEAKMTFSCFEESATCMSQLGAVIEARRLAWARLGRTDGAWAVQVRVLDIQEGRYTQDERFSLPGGDDRVPELEALVAGIMKGERPEVKPTSRLIIESDPPSAEVKIDGKLMGPAPVTTRLPLGRYLVELSLEGRMTVRRELDLGPTELRERIALPLPPEEPPPAPPPPSDWPTWVGIGASGLAVVAAGTATAAYVVASGNADEAATTGKATRYNNLQRSHNSLETLHLASVITAGVAGAAGVYFLFFHPEPEQPVVTPTLGGAAIFGTF